MTKTIPLSAGKQAVVDDEDYDYLIQWKWSFNGRYAARCVKSGGRSRSIYMHREIMSPPCNMEVDHIDCDRLNNRRTNLRICTRAQNSKNRYGREGASQYKGVTFNKIAGRWEAGIGINGAKRSLGYYDTEQDAALAYDEAARIEYGEFAKPNFPGIQASVYSQERERLNNKHARTAEMKRLLAEETPLHEVAEKLGFDIKYVREMRSRIRSGKMRA